MPFCGYFAVVMQENLGCHSLQRTRDSVIWETIHSRNTKRRIVSVSMTFSASLFHETTLHATILHATTLMQQATSNVSWNKFSNRAGDIPSAWLQRPREPYTQRISFRNLIKSNRNQIGLDWNQTNVCLVPNESVHGKYNLISVWFDDGAKCTKTFGRGST